VFLLDAEAMFTSCLFLLPPLENCFFSAREILRSQPRKGKEKWDGVQKVSLGYMNPVSN
jgi:hypothetical protein